MCFAVLDISCFSYFKHSIRKNTYQIATWFQEGNAFNATFFV